MLISNPRRPALHRLPAPQEYGQTIREEGPEHHVTKQGTPIMGGLLTLGAATAAYLAVARYTVPALTVLFVTLACGAIGFLDDFIKLTHRRSLGLNARWKLLCSERSRSASASPPGTSTCRRTSTSRDRAPRALVGVVRAALPRHRRRRERRQSDRRSRRPRRGTGIIALFTYSAINVIAWIRSGPPGHRFETKLDLALVGAALIGGLIGFLWYNAFPAEVFMGDTGSMAIGGALAAFAIMTKTIFLLLLIGGIFAIEALSVILQVFSFRYWGRRIFLMTPIHHHFEMKAWSETKIMVRFWIVTGLLCAAAFALYYRYFRGFR
jgi:phospho-N-acetylmuramoyl-pentapeptide-transferase